MPRRAIIAAALALWAGAVVASPGSGSGPGNLAGLSLRGEATFRVVGLAVYHARLYTPGAAAVDLDDPLGLEVTYLRGLSRSALVDTTLKELRRLGAATGPGLSDQLLGCYGDVARGDTYLAIPQGSDRITFWLNGQKMCNLGQPGIRDDYFGIFLGDNTRSSAFTQALRGE